MLERAQCANAHDLLGLLQNGNRADLLDELVAQLTVGETYFLREPAHVNALRRIILPDIVERRRNERRLRIWSAGCSTGEEPYTLAILLAEQAVLDDWSVLLFGTDVNRDSLRTARDGCYPAWSFRAASEQFRQRYFTAAEHGWRLNESIRRMVRFAWSNLGSESLMPPSGDFHLIVCRNVTIYFDEAATQRLYRTLIESLAPNAWLVLGPSDPMPAQREELERVEAHQAVLWRRRPAQSLIPVARPKRPADVVTQRRSNAARPKPTVAPQALPAPAAVKPVALDDNSGKADLEAGLLALESGSAVSALEWLRRATFRDPRSAIAQFALARAYLGIGDLPRAQAALLHTQRLLKELGTETLVPDSDALPVETLRQAVHTHLSVLEGARA